jgi:hypothetical protein
VNAFSENSESQAGRRRDATLAAQVFGAFVQGLTDIVDPGILLGAEGPAAVELPSAPPAAQDRDNIAGDWRRVGGYLAGAMATEASHGKE